MLTGYESRQVEAIAAWKAELPSVLMSAYQAVSRPFSRLVMKVMPRNLVHEALAKVEEQAVKNDSVRDILDAAAATTIGQLGERSLEECDRLAHGQHPGRAPRASGRGCACHRGDRPARRRGRGRGSGRRPHSL
ncbi:MAG: hypothetical protein U0835_11405 [Isosphaeraceae bacterium]